jgi:hypothetical protein
MRKHGSVGPPEYIPDPVWTPNFLLAHAVASCICSMGCRIGGASEAAESGGRGSGAGSRRGIRGICSHLGASFHALGAADRAQSQKLGSQTAPRPASWDRGPRPGPEVETADRDQAQKLGIPMGRRILDRDHA